MIVAFLLILSFLQNPAQQPSDQELLTSAFETSNPNQSLELLNQIQHPDDFTDSLQLLHLLTRGIAYGKLGKDDSAVYFLDKCLTNSSYDYLSIKAANAKGLVFFHSGNWEQALVTFQKALDIIENSHFLDEEAAVLGNMGGVYFQSGDHESAIKYSARSLELAYEQDNTEDISFGHLRLAVVYEEVDSLKLSIFHNSKASEYAENLGNYVLLTYIEKTLGNIYRKLGQLDSALYRHKRAREFAKREGEEDNITSTTSELATIYLEMGNLTMAQKEANDILLFSGPNGYPVHNKTAHDVLYQVALQKGDFKQALNNRNKYFLIHDSLNTADTKERIAELEIKYETAQKEKEIVEANAEIDKNKRFQFFLLLILGLIILFSTIAIFLLIKQFRLRRTLLSQEIDNLRLQISTIFSGKIDNLELTKEQLDNNLDKPLSSREYEILNFALSDKSNNEIAKLTGVSVSTIKFHLKNAYQKLGVAGRKEAMEFVINKN